MEKKRKNNIKIKKKGQGKRKTWKEKKKCV